MMKISRAGRMALNVLDSGHSEPFQIVRKLDEIGGKKKALEPNLRIH